MQGISQYKSTYFTPAEFKRLGCSYEDMNPLLLRMLDALRKKVGKPLVLSSAFRSRQHEIEKGRSGNSAHTTGEAVDIVCMSDADRYTIVTAALQVGFTRIGVGKTFVHLDVATRRLPAMRIWGY